jgi:hypothetical protein
MGRVRSNAASRPTAPAAEEHQQGNNRQREEDGMDDCPACDRDYEQDDARDEPQHEHSSFLGLAARGTYTRPPRDQSKCSKGMGGAGLEPTTFCL